MSYIIEKEIQRKYQVCKIEEVHALPMSIKITHFWAIQSNSILGGERDNGKPSFDMIKGKVCKITHLFKQFLRNWPKYVKVGQIWPK